MMKIQLLLNQSIIIILDTQSAVHGSGISTAESGLSECTVE